MEYRERIGAKVGVLFQIADQYLSCQIPLEQAKEMISSEMVHIRPAQFEAMKAELSERLKNVGRQPKSEKLFNLFRNYISPPFHKLQNGHPLRNYFDENSSVRSYLLRIDEMEEEEAAIEDWAEIYESLSGFGVHIKRQEKNFYPLLIPIGMRQQVEKAKEFGKEILEEIDKNQKRLKNGNVVDFLFYQRSLSQAFMNYLDLEERVLYPKALISFTDWDFESLRKTDDQEGYVFIEQPADFVPNEKGNARSERKELIEECHEGIDSSQNIAELFSMYPKFQEDFYQLDEELKGLKGPLGMDLLKNSTVGMIAKSLRIDTADLVERINKLLKSY